MAEFIMTIGTEPGLISHYLKFNLHYQMNCVICNSPTKPFLSKNFIQFDLGKIDYVKCVNCGFVISKTHYEMTDAEWENLNQKWVSLYQGSDFNPEDPRWMERLNNQANIIGDIAELGLLPAGDWLDYGAGDGKLADALKQRFNLDFNKYEHSSNRKDYLSDEGLRPGRFSFLLNTSVMEHLRSRAALDGLFDLMSKNGVMGIHTLVMENIPHDTEWFYLLSVHCSFYTNMAMQILFEQKGYTCSIYNVASRLWFWFKQPAEAIKPAIEQANKRNKGEFYHYIFKEGFVDYWK